MLLQSKDGLVWHDQPFAHGGVEPVVVVAIDPSNPPALTEVPVCGWPRMTWAGALCRPKTRDAADPFTSACYR
jgi:hypothetical protein